MSKNKIAPKGLPRYVVTSSDGDQHWTRSQKEALQMGSIMATRGSKKVHMFKVNYDFIQKVVVE